MSSMTVFEAEAAAETAEARRAGLVALAEYLNKLKNRPAPWDVFAAFCPGVDRQTIERWGEDLLRLVKARATHPAAVTDFDVQVAVDYLTGVRR